MRDDPTALFQSFSPEDTASLAHAYDLSLATLMPRGGDYLLTGGDARRQPGAARYVREAIARTVLQMASGGERNAVTLAAATIDHIQVD